MQEESLASTELPFVISKSKAVVTNDSAPLHIASAMSVPTVALFGPASKNKYGPYPKSHSNFKVIEGHSNQIATISSGQVLEALKRTYLMKFIPKVRSKCDPRSHDHFYRLNLFFLRFDRIP